MTDSLDIVDIDSTDKNSCSSSELETLFHFKYHAAARSAIGLEKLYILHIDSSWASNKVACALSNHSVHLASSDTLARETTFIAHEQTIANLKFDGSNSNYLYTASVDGRVRFWDLRSTKKHQREFSDTTKKGALKPITAFGLNSNGETLCAGTEQIKEDVFLLFWDLRSSKLLQTYSDSHQDDITDVKFHPTEPNKLATCSTDGLVNVFDISQTDEDEAVLNSLNTETSAGRLQWIRNQGKIDRLAVVTHIEGIQFWESKEASPYESYSRKQITEAMRRTNTETSYVAECFQSDDFDSPIVLAGSNATGQECLRLLTAEDKQLKPYSLLRESKMRKPQLVRCATYHSQSGVLITGGEDGILNVWKPGDEVEEPAHLKQTSKKAPSRRQKPY